jgi:hypothetical protein
MSGASIFEFRDLDVLLKLREEQDVDGFVESAHLSRALGIGERGTDVASRLNWMRHYGMLEFDSERRLWRLTSAAERVTEAKLRAAQSRTIEAIPDESLIDVMAKVTQRYRSSNGMLAEMLRREFKYGTRPL